MIKTRDDVCKWEKTHIDKISLLHVLKRNKAAWVGSVANLTTKGRPHLIIIIISSSSLFERGYKAAHKNTTTCAQKYQREKILFKYLRKSVFRFSFKRRRWKLIRFKGIFSLCAESSAHGSVMCALCVVIIITKEVLRSKGVLGEKKKKFTAQSWTTRALCCTSSHFYHFFYFFIFFFGYCWIMTSFSLLYKTKCLVSRKEMNRIRKRLMNKGRAISQLNSSCSRRKKKEKVKQGRIIYATLA